jgi:hypothetical protein
MNYNTYHVVDLPDGTFDAFDTDTKERYNFKTKQFATTFCKLVNDYYNQKNRGLWFQSGITLTSNTALGRITPTFNLTLANVTYRLDVSKPPNLFAKVFLKLIGFKK